MMKAERAYCPWRTRRACSEVARARCRWMVLRCCSRARCVPLTCAGGIATPVDVVLWARAGSGANISAATPIQANLFMTLSCSRNPDR